MTQIYGNEGALGMMDAMCKSRRLPHSFLIYGDEGLGKKLLAKHLAMRLLCEHPETAPCHDCKPCRNVEADQHPDVIWVEHSGKLQGFSVETIRHVQADAYVVPNNGARKFYIFSDADHMTVQAQNALLKLVEEPPDCTYFIFTARSRDVFLETIRSRVSAIGVSECTAAQCAEALRAQGYDEAKCREAIAAFGGNIGMCLSFLTTPAMQEVVALTKTLTNSIMERDEYTLLAALTACSGDKPKLRMALRLLDQQLRDALVLRLQSDARCIGCDASSARDMSARLSLARAEQLHAAIAKTSTDLEANVGSVLAVTALCAQIMR